jgi:hypothetical protein
MEAESIKLSRSASLPLRLLPKVDSAVLSKDHRLVA